MKIVIAGAGDVGFHLAKLLSSEEHDIVLIDCDQEVLDYAQSHVDVLTLRGDSTSIKTLREAGLKSTDLLIAATSSENVNIITAVLGKRLGAKRTVARIQKDEYLLNGIQAEFRNVGIDALISPKQLASNEICRLINEAAVTDMHEFENGKLFLIGIHLEAGSPILGASLAETAHLNPDLAFRPIAIHRDDATIIPRANTRFQADDHVYFITCKGGIDQILTNTGKKRVKIKKVMILGGSAIGLMTARQLEKQYQVKVIEKDREKCLQLAESLNNTLIINGDGGNVELLEEEGLADMDAFLALTGNSETNIISSLVARNHNVVKSIALVENTDYIHLSQRVGVDTLINRKLIAANSPETTRQRYRPSMTRWRPIPTQATF
ncbi:MAG: Trk system potassium transporter TrkA, partial [Bacteroidota bacterium]